MLPSAGTHTVLCCTTGEATAECADTHHLHHQLHLEAGPDTPQVTHPWVPVGGGPQGWPQGPPSIQLGPACSGGRGLLLGRCVLLLLYCAGFADVGVSDAQQTSGLPVALRWLC